MTVPAKASVGASASTSDIRENVSVSESPNGVILVIRKRLSDGSMMVRVETTDPNVQENDSVTIFVDDHESPQKLIGILSVGESILSENDGAGGCLVVAVLVVSGGGFPLVRLGGFPGEFAMGSDLGFEVLTESVRHATGESREAWRRWALSLAREDPRRVAVQEGMRQ